MASERSHRGLRTLVLAAALVAGAGCQHFRAAPLHPEGPPGAWHLVQPGETLADIAGRAGVPVEDLEEINGLRRNDPLEPGKLVYVLDPNELTRPSGPPAETAPPADRTLRWPLAAPRLSSPFGTRQGRPHEGIDLAAPTGTPIYAADSGQVVYAGDRVRGYGNMVVLRHAGDVLTVYAHNSVVLVRTGDTVSAGQEIARVGQSGRATAPHLHFEVRRGEVPQDPLRYLPPLR